MGGNLVFEKEAGVVFVAVESPVCAGAVSDEGDNDVFWVEVIIVYDSAIQTTVIFLYYIKLWFHISVVDN